jgi:hypothetical protein
MTFRGKQSPGAEIWRGVFDSVFLGLGGGDFLF